MAVLANEDHLGSNVAAWLDVDELNGNVFTTRVWAAGIGRIRIPGGSWSNLYGLSCEVPEIAEYVIMLE
jgi:hypothetical protein